MNQRARYSLRASFVDCREDNQTVNSKDSYVPEKESQAIPDVVEITRLMIGSIAGKNIRNMTKRELETYYKITNRFLSLADGLNGYHHIGSLKV